MLVLPFQVSKTHFSVFVVLQDDNLARIKDYDPAEVTLSKFPEPFRGLHLKDVIIGYATDADLDEVMRLARKGKTLDALKFLSRGFKFRPEQGDHDRGYESP